MPLKIASVVYSRISVASALRVSKLFLQSQILKALVFREPLVGELFYLYKMSAIALTFLRDNQTNCRRIILPPIFDTNWCHFFEDYSHQLPHNYSSLAKCAQLRTFF